MHERSVVLDSAGCHGEAVGLQGVVRFVGERTPGHKPLIWPTPAQTE